MISAFKSALPLFDASIAFLLERNFHLSVLAGFGKPTHPIMSVAVGGEQSFTAVLHCKQMSRSDSNKHHFEHTTVS